MLDEICVAVACGALSADKVIELISSKPKDMDIVLTGRYCPGKIQEIADMVSEVKEVKHHYAKGVQAREGIEF